MVKIALLLCTFLNDYLEPEIFALADSYIFLARSHHPLHPRPIFFAQFILLIFCPITSMLNIYGCVQGSGNSQRWGRGRPPPTQARQGEEKVQVVQVVEQLRRPFKSFRPGLKRKLLCYNRGSLSTINNIKASLAKMLKVQCVVVFEIARTFTGIRRACDPFRDSGRITFKVIKITACI